MKHLDLLGTPLKSEFLFELLETYDVQNERLYFSHKIRRKAVWVRFDEEAFTEATLVAEPWAEPFLCFFEALAFALCVVFDLVLLEVVDHEVVRVGVGEVDATDCGAGVHGAGLGEFDSGFLRGVE